MIDRFTGSDSSEEKIMISGVPQSASEGPKNPETIVFLASDKPLL